MTDLGHSQKGDIIVCLILGLVALVLWCAIIAWIRWEIGGIQIG